jgi:hypothetical protein
LLFAFLDVIRRALTSQTVAQARRWALLKEMDAGKTSNPRYANAENVAKEITGMLEHHQL